MPGKLSWEEAVQWARSTPEMKPLVTNCYYDDPVGAAAARFMTSEEWPAITSLLGIRVGQKILEIGAGRGIVSFAFTKAGCEVTAVEPDTSAVVGSGAIRQLCAESETHINFVEEMGERLPFATGTFHHVFCRGVLHHAYNLRAMCSEAFRVLAPGGMFLAVKEHVADSADELARFLEIHPLHHLYGGEHAHPLRDYKDAIRSAGFRALRVFAPFDHPISYSPTVTFEGLRAMARRALCARLPRNIADAMIRSDDLVRLYGRWLSLRCKTPGRLYSFLAIKPS